MTSTFSEAREAEEEWGKEAQDMLCGRDLLDNSQSSMISLNELLCFMFLYLCA